MQAAAVLAEEVTTPRPSESVAQIATGLKLKSLIDDVYIQDLRHKTLRGLEGQVHRGFSAGGRAFGYRSVPVPDPSGRTDFDRQHHRHRQESRRS